MNKAIEALRNNPGTVLTKNISIPPEEMEELANKWKVNKKPGRIAGTFTNVSDLMEHHIKHFKNAPYMFRPMPGSMYGGMLLDDNIDYVHIVIMSEKVLEFILDLGKPKKEEPEEEDDIDLDLCEQCNKMAWDGYICHVCGMKHI
jgi:hypothetical protein